MLRNACVRIKAVDDIEVFDVFRRLLRQVRGAAAAENHDIDFVAPILNILDADDRNILGPDFDACRGAAREDGHELHVVIFLNGAFYATAKVAITENTNANAHKNTFLF